MSQKKRFQIPRFYKTLLALTVIIGPITWLMLTEDGRRRSDLLVLGFTDKPLVQMRLAPLASAFTEEQVREFLPELQWQCSDNLSSFGERSCVAIIGAFNEVPANSMAMYFQGGALQAMKVEYRAAYHASLIDILSQILNRPENDQGVLRWVTDHGLVLLPQTLEGDPETGDLLWLSAGRAMQAGS
jgi:hypothetical protein